jgi:hypothetical protein
MSCFSTIPLASGQAPNGYGAPDGSPNHFLCATGPTDIFPRIVDGDRQVIAAPVLPGLGAGRTLRHVIPADPSDLANVVENTELVTRAGNERLVGRIPFSLKLRWHRLARDEPPQLFLAYLSQTLQVRHLSLQVVICSVKPIAPIRAAVDAKRAADRVSELARVQFVVLRKDFDSFGETNPFDFHSELQG